MVTVAKFGGAALADQDGFARAARIVTTYDRPVVVVASAMAGITDTLDAFLDAPGDEASVQSLVDDIEARHQAALPDAGDPSAADAIAALIAGLRRLMLGISFTAEVSARLRDDVLSHGERLAVCVLAAALRAAGQPARSHDAAAAGIITDGPFGSARPSADVGQSIAKALADVDHVPVVTGFYGVDADGRPTSFGRGGSDYVASLIGAALQADAVDLWKDVPGFLTADPKAVPDATLVTELDYGEAAELAYFGANVLHPRAVEPVAEAGIPIRIRHLAQPDAPGTVVHGNAPRSDRMVRSAASRAGLALVRLNGPGMGHTPGIARRVFEALGDAGVNVLNMANSQATFALLIGEDQAVAANDALQPLVGGSIRSVDVIPGRSLVCVVGRGLGETPGSAARILQAVSDRAVNIEMISLGASEIAIDFIVPSEQRVDALQGLHRVFMEVPA